MQTIIEKSETKMSVKRKLMQARAAIQSLKLRKTGKGIAGGGRTYEYYELDDIVPHITKIFNQLGLISIFLMDAGGAILRVEDVDSDEFILFTSPIPAIPNAQHPRSPMQELGSMHTYLRRYLFINALDICEPDTVELAATPPDFAIATKKEIEKCQTMDELDEIKKKAQLIKWPPEDKKILNCAYREARNNLQSRALAV